MENKIKCSLTDEVIGTFGLRGIKRHGNYRDIWFVLSDKSKLKQMVSKNSLENLNEKNLNDCLEKVKDEWIESTKTKPIYQNKKVKIIQRLKQIDYLQVVDKNDILFEKICQ